MDEAREHEVVAVPPDGTLTGLVVQLVKDTPVGAEFSVIVTSPLNARILVTVTLVDPEAPVLKLTGPVAVREKLGG